MKNVAAIAVTIETLDSHGNPSPPNVALYSPTGAHRSISQEALHHIKAGALPLSEVFVLTPEEESA